MIRGALNGSISIFYDKVWCCCIPKKTLVALLFSAYIFMFNKTILLFHLSFPLLSLFLSILMQYFVNSNLHASTLYTLIIHKASELDNLKIIQLQASGTFNASYFHYVNYIRTSINTSTRTFSSLFLFYEYDSSVLHKI